MMGEGQCMSVLSSTVQGVGVGCMLGFLTPFMMTVNVINGKATELKSLPTTVCMIPPLQH